MRSRKRVSLSQLVLVLFLFFVTLTMLVPLLNILAKSLSSPSESIGMSGLAILPRQFDLLNYRIVFSHPILVPSLFNSLIITLVGTAVNIALTTTAAYALTRPKINSTSSPGRTSSQATTSPFFERTRA